MRDDLVAAGLVVEDDLLPHMVAMREPSARPARRPAAVSICTTIRTFCLAMPERCDRRRGERDCGNG